MVIRRTDLQEFMLNSDKLRYFIWQAGKRGIVGMISVYGEGEVMDFGEGGRKAGRVAVVLTDEEHR
jgi:hypothetical protein